MADFVEKVRNLKSILMLAQLLQRLLVLQKIIESEIEIICRYGKRMLFLEWGKILYQHYWHKPEGLAFRGECLLPVTKQTHFRPD